MIRRVLLVLALTLGVLLTPGVAQAGHTTSIVHSPNSDRVGLYMKWTDLGNGAYGFKTLARSDSYGGFSGNGTTYGVRVDFFVPQNWCARISEYYDNSYVRTRTLCSNVSGGTWDRARHGHKSQVAFVQL
jgi:hypothetical protein